MSKRNVAYVKPQDPSFLRRMKEQIGYKEGPTVDTKRQKLEDLSGSECESDAEGCPTGGPRSGGQKAAGAGALEDEKPQVVVLQEGDLTAEEAEAERARLEKEEREKPADLTQRIVFKAKHKPAKELDGDLAADSNANHGGKEKKSKKKSKDSKTSAKLSFNQDEEEEDTY